MITKATRMAIATPPPTAAPTIRVMGLLVSTPGSRVVGPGVLVGSGVVVLIGGALVVDIVRSGGGGVMSGGAVAVTTTTTTT